MKRFFGNDINQLQVEQLLQATPFQKEPRINFDHRLTPEVFFKYLYTETQADLTSDERNERNNFIHSINKALRIVDNAFAKVDLIHICGYAGCGKTTFLHHLLWTKYPKYQPHIVDFEGTVTVSKAYIKVLSQKILKTFLYETSQVDNCLLLKQLDLSSFDNAATNVISFLELLALNHELSQEQAERLLHDNLCKNYYTEQENLRSLLLLDFILAIYDNARTELNIPLFVVFDNVDSIDDSAQEHLLITVLKKFVNECNFFFADNSSNNQRILGRKIDDLLGQSKFVCFLTTRVATFNRYLYFEPDLEQVYGWVSLTMPEKYYSHLDIIRKRVDFYENMEAQTNSQTLDELIAIRQFAEYIYRNNVFAKLFNGNFRFCIQTICKLLSPEYDRLINEGRALSSKRSSIPETSDGANGFIISMVLHLFKKEGIYNEKLHLSECQRDGSISLSRMILTILREKNGTCSMLDMYLLLSPFFNPDTINECVFDLAERCRDVWRRLLVFSGNPPHSPGDLSPQYELFKSKDYTLSKYSTIHICTAGLVYIESIVPHFEFMLSRHRSTTYASNKNYHPLFAESSEDLLPPDARTGECKYRFERKIDWVYNDVHDCCFNSRVFSERIMKHYGMSPSEFISNSYYNYRSDGYRQSYGARLVFSHIGYIERYRRYLLSKYYSFTKLTSKEDINRRLVTRIKKYLNLYYNELLCFRTDKQNEAAEYLRQAIQIIEESNYTDYFTQIEIK